MDEHNKILGNDGPGIPLSACGQEWSVGYLCNDVRARVGKRLYLNAVDDAASLRQERPQQYRDLMKSITDTSAAKGFMWGSPVCEEFVHRGVGAQYLLFCLLFLYHGKGKDRITEEKVAEMWADNELGCVAALNAALEAVPNSRPPVEAGGEDR